MESGCATTGNIQHKLSFMHMPLFSAMCTSFYTHRVVVEHSS